MDIAKKTEGDRMIIAVTGRVDTTTAPELDAGLKLAGNETLTLDLSGVPYMSSAGLRCLLTAQKTMMAGGGSMTIVGVQAAVREVLDITGFSSILTLA
ncbi:MAG: STAS domain-containing protein [bacterium]|nr:STAS domain-containing protein [bacterium]